MSKREQTPNEELANAITHGVGIVFCLIAMPILFNRAWQDGSMSSFWGALAFGVGMTMVYTSSTLYHLIKDKHYKYQMRKVDHISIYFLIAGSYTPLIIKYLPAHDATVFLSVMWGLVVVGIVFKLLFTHRFKIVSILLYLTMGWMALFVIGPIKQNVPPDLLWWIIAGGISYTVGVFFYVRSKINYFHAVWHCFVLGGTICHYVFIYKSIV